VSPLKITEDVILHVAGLSRLAVSPSEVARLAPQLSDIMEYAEQLQEVDLTDVPPTSHPFPFVNVVRKDEMRPSLTRQEALQNAPDTDGVYVRVPAVLEG